MRDIYIYLTVDVSRGYEVQDIIALGERLPKSQVQQELDALYRATTRERIRENKIIDSVKMYLTIKRICEEKVRKIEYKDYLYV